MMRQTDRSLFMAAASLTASVAWLLAAPQSPWSPTAAEQTTPVATPSLGRPATQPAGQGAPKACELLVLPEHDERLLAMVAPVVAKVSEGRRAVLLAVTSDGTREEVRRLLAQVGMAKALSLRRSSSPAAGDSSPVRTQREIPVPDGTMAAGLELAKRFWGRSDGIVLAVEGDGEAGLLGAALAAHQRVPFLLVPHAETGANLAGSLQQVGAKRVTVVTCGEAAPPAWARRLPQQVKVLDPGGAQAALIRTIGPPSVRNVIVVRAPTGPAAAARASWLAPYLSYARKSAIVVVSSSDAGTVEREVAAVVSAYTLRPRTVTILADHDAIGVHIPAMALRLGGYAVDVEPCSGAGDRGAAAYGVGRIPFQDAARASLLIARGLAREQRTIGPAGGVLMVANPRTEYGALPLAETVARLNVEEFRNVRVSVSAHFGVPSDGPDIRTRAGTAGLIVYQGHISDQAIFRGPGWQQPGESVDIASIDQEPNLPLFSRARYWLCDRALLLVEDAYSAADYVCYELPVIARERLSGLRPDDMGSQQDEGVGPAVAGTRADGNSPGPMIPPASWPDDAGKAFPGPTIENDRPLELEGCPLVILQSCSSLRGEAASAAMRAGACGVIGSVTGIHSASGSSFVKAWSDAVLYHGTTAGEAMRDARNYFLLLARLKEARGHREQAKVLRVGLSFRLWGDPETVVLPEIKGQPTRRPITGMLQGRQVTLRLPRRKLPEARTSRYVVRAFPGSQTAGIVKRLKDKDYRRLMPVYFLRLDRPAGLSMDNRQALARQGDTDRRAVFSTDPLGRYVYVLYLPDEERGREKVTLEFHP
jgi:hypothetical protein